MSDTFLFVRRDSNMSSTIHGAACISTIKSILISLGFTLHYFIWFIYMSLSFNMVCLVVLRNDQFPFPLIAFLRHIPPPQQLGQDGT